METNERDKLHEIYCIVLENNQANIQILKNQKCLLQQYLSPIPIGMTKAETLTEETNNILRMITSGKS